MRRFKDDDVRAIREGTNIVNLVNEHVELKRSGGSWKGLCPFHDERSPSFSVTASTGTVHCFGCGVGGDAIWFIQEIGGYNFPQAVEVLAERINYALTFEETDAEKDDRATRARLLQVNTAAEVFFGRALTGPGADAGRSLLTSRGFDVEHAVANFGCGYAPSSGLMDYLHSNRFTDAEIVAAGLAVQSDRRAPHERFRNRLVWSIKDPFGKVIGFGARRLFDDDPVRGKFINTSETAVYKKSQVLFGFSDARRDIATTRQAVVVEGYTDVMAFRLAGVNNVVASCGTSFTPEHMAILARIVGDTGEVVFAFDDDSAGRKAALSVYDLARSSPVRRLSTLPASAGLDPDELRQAQGDQALVDLVAARRPLIETVILRTIDSVPTETVEDRIVALDTVLPVVAHADEPAKTEYAQVVARRLRLAAPQVIARLAEADRSTRAAEGAQPAGAVPSNRRPAGWAEREVLQVMCQERTACLELLDKARPLLTLPASKQVVAVLDAAVMTDWPDTPWALHVLDTAGPDDRRLVTALLGMETPCEESQVVAYGRSAIDRLREADRVRSHEAARDRLANAVTPDEKRAALAASLALHEQRLAS